MLRMCVLALALVSAAVADETTVADDGPMTTAAPPITEFDLSIKHVQSGTSSIKFTWDAAVPDWMKVKSYAISAAITGKSDSHAVMTYPALPGNEEYFEADDLVMESTWTLCITSTVMNGTDASTQSTVEFRHCMDSWTIPYIRSDSIYGLIIVIGGITFLILLGYIQWKVAVTRQERKRAAAEAAAAAAEEEEDEDSKKEK